MLNDDDNWLHR